MMRVLVVDLEEDIRVVFGTTGADRQINMLPGRELSGNGTQTN